MIPSGIAAWAWSAALISILSAPAWAQSAGTAGTVSGTVTDPTGAAVPGARVELHNPVSRFQRTTQTNASGYFRFTSVPINPYHLDVTAPGFDLAQRDINVRSSVPAELNIQLRLAAEQTSVTVHSDAAEVMENAPAAHTDIDHNLISKLPVGGQGINEVITLAAPGVVANSNGMFHPLGEHADTTFVVDSQPISDQQSRAFSNQLALNTIQSMEVISGVPPAEYGDKAGLIVNATTRSGLGQKPSGSFGASYGSFGTWGENLAFGLGGARWGNFTAVNSAGSGRFLDTPELFPLHDHGNTESVFDHLDFQPSAYDTLHLNLSLARTWFQVPNTYDQQDAGQDQRQWLRSFNVAPSWLRLFGPSTLLSVNPYVRQDLVRYSPSRDPFADQPATAGQQRRLTNFGIRTTLAWVKGAHNIKAGVQVADTKLSENFNLGLTDPAFNPVCLDSQGQPVTAPSPAGPEECAAAGFRPNPDLQPGLVPFDLSRGGGLFTFRGHADIKQQAAYIQDSLSLGGLSLSAGLRFDNYDGLSHENALQPRLGVSYMIKETTTILRAGWGRLFETPYNENLVLSSATGSGGLATNVFGAYGEKPLRPGVRNQFNVGLQQGLGRLAVVDANYFWKFTDNAFDFDMLFNTPIVFPIEWRKSKIDGLAVRVNLLNVRGLLAYSDMGHTRARFFGPETGGLIFNSPLSAGVFRVDHDQAFEQTMHVQYQFRNTGPWVALTWRYDSGMVAGSVPDFAAALALTGDQQAAMGLFCGGVFATVGNPLVSCNSPRFGATRVRIPAPGTENDDHNPARIAPRHLIDLGIGLPDPFRRDQPRWNLRLTARNLTNRAALYNFLSTFSGTHFVPPRTYQAELVVNF